MLACVDVDYRQGGAWAGLMTFEQWDDPQPLGQRVVFCDQVGEYRSGQFYARELPALLTALDTLPQMPDLVVVDGYCWLGPERPGLGSYLSRSIGRPVMGVAKNPFRACPGTPVLRGRSQTPLYVTACGLSPQESVEWLQRMHGDYRIPTLLRRVDQLARGRHESVLRLRPEALQEHGAVAQLVFDAFLGHPHHPPGSLPCEPAIVAGLRSAGALTLSLVAEQAGEVLGHIAFSPVVLNGQSGTWFGLGPVSVKPAWQNQGIGSSLVRYGISLIRRAGAGGIVLLGEPEYYSRFGFRAHSGLTCADAPPEYFLALSLAEPVPLGEIAYHRAFEAGLAENELGRVNPNSGG